MSSYCQEHSGNSLNLIPSLQLRFPTNTISTSIIKSLDGPFALPPGSKCLSKFHTYLQTQNFPLAIFPFHSRLQHFNWNTVLLPKRYLLQTREKRKENDRKKNYVLRRGD